MTNMPQEQIYDDRRAEPRRPADDYYSVVFQPKRPGPLYQFKIWNISDHGLCILVKKESRVLNQIHVGDEIEMTYYPAGRATEGDPITTRIVHITPKTAGKFKGHLLIGLAVI